MGIDSYRQTQTQSTSAALADAVEAAGLAPSMHNTQPWRWRVDGDTLELHAEPTRELPSSDGGGRMTVLGCGAGLHHARTALAAHGWRVEVDRVPDPGQPGLLARLRLSGRLAVTRDALRLLHTIRDRRLESRPGVGTTVSSGDIVAIRTAVEAEQAWLHILRPDEVLGLANAAARADRPDEFDPHWRDEIADWPDDAVRYAVLYGIEDTPGAWLHAGEALSSAWLTAVAHGVSVQPHADLVEVEITRVILRRLLGQRGEPFLVLRFGQAVAVGSHSQR